MPYHNQCVEQSWNMVWHFVFAGDAQAGSDIVKLSDLIFDPLHFIICLLYTSPSPRDS